MIGFFNAIDEWNGMEKVTINSEQDDSIMMVILILMVVVFLYYVITEYFQNSYIDCILFLTLLISHLIWDYYFLPIEVLVALSRVNLLSRFFKKKRSQ